MTVNKIQLHKKFWDYLVSIGTLIPEEMLKIHKIVINLG